MIPALRSTLRLSVVTIALVLCGLLVSACAQQSTTPTQPPAASATSAATATASADTSVPVGGVVTTAPGKPARRTQPTVNWSRRDTPVLVNTPKAPDKSFIGDPGALFKDGTFYVYVPTAWQNRPEAKPDDVAPNETALSLALATSTDGATFTFWDNTTPNNAKDDYVLMRDARYS